MTEEPIHHNGYHTRRLPLKKSHWSFNDFTDKVNRVEHGLKPRRTGTRTGWQPAKADVEQLMKLLNCSYLEAASYLRAARK